MSFDWQDLIVVAAIALAGFYLARVGWQTFARRRGACGGCANCPAEDEGPQRIADGRPMVDVEQLSGTASSASRPPG